VVIPAAIIQFPFIKTLHLPQFSLQSCFFVVNHTAIIQSPFTKAFLLPQNSSFKPYFVVISAAINMWQNYAFISPGDIGASAYTKKVTNWTNY